MSSLAALGFVQVVSDALAVTRLEVLAFGIAMLMYVLLVSKRSSPQTEKAHQKVQQPDVEDPCSVKNTPAVETPRGTCKLPTKSSVDVAKYIIKIRKFASAKDLKSAESTFDELKDAGAELDRIIYKTMIDACVTCQNLKAAHLWMEQARQAGMIDAVCFNTIIKAHLLKNDLEKARTVLVKMQAAGMKPSPAISNELLHAVVKSDGNTDIVWRMIDEMMEVGLAPNKVTCSILWKGLNELSSDAEVHRTMDLLDSLREPMDDMLISSVVESSVRIGKAGLLAAKIKHLQDSNRVAIRSNHTCGSLIKAFGHAHDLPGVWRQWDAMRAQFVRPAGVTLSCMVEALISNDCSEDAFQLVEQLQTDAQCRGIVNAAIYGSILKGFAREKKLERVWDVYQEIDEKHPEISHAREIQACLMHT